MTFYQTRDAYRIVESYCKNENQEISSYFKVQGLVKGWFRNRWVDVHGYTYPDGGHAPMLFNYKDEAIAFVKRARTPLPKDKYTYM